MTGIERLRKLSEDMLNLSLWVRLTSGTEKDWDCYQGDGRTINDELLSIADQIEREHNVSDREEHDAAAWVREHGGLDAVKKEWNLRGNFKRQLEKAQEKVERQQRHIEFVQGKCHERLVRIAALNKTVAEMRPRLMPEGMEWLVEAWPRFEDGEPVKLLDDFERYGEENGVSTVTMYADGSFALNFRAYSKGERVNRPAPKVLDADGAEIREGDTVYEVDDGWRLTVREILSDRGDNLVELEHSKGGDAVYRYGHHLTHRAPVLAADGRPLREGETVWRVDDGREFYVYDIDPKRGVGVSWQDGESEATGSINPDQLTHQRPLLDADGVPLEVGQTVWDTNGDELVIGAIEDGGHMVACRYADVGDGIPTHGMWSPSDLTHQRPDSWERLEEDAEKDPCSYFGFDEEEICGKCPASGKNCEQTMARDLVRRAKALADRERGE